VTILPGDGIGPEVIGAARTVLDACGVALAWDEHDVGLATLATTGELVPRSTVASIRRNGVALKGPTSTAKTGAVRSANVALRRALELFVQLRPVRSFTGAPARFGPVDLVLSRVMTEDLNAGIEYESGSARARELADWLASDGVTVDPTSGFSIKITSFAAARRALAFTFQWAREHRRQRVTVAHKSTIMRATDAVFLDAARAVAGEQRDIEMEDRLVDDVAMQLVRDPRGFDVLVTSNLYGDILSGIAAGLVGGVGLLPGGIYGDRVAVFEAAHGSAPKYAGQDRANPTAAILSGALLLRHLGEEAAAQRVERAAATVLAEGRYVTADLCPVHRPVGTRAMAAAIRDRL
jgi:isocitrate dehydrogenase (NAD+)